MRYLPLPPKIAGLLPPCSHATVIEVWDHRDFPLRRMNAPVGVSRRVRLQCETCYEITADACVSGALTVLG